MSSSAKKMFACALFRLFLQVRWYMGCRVHRGILQQFANKDLRQTAKSWLYLQKKCTDDETFCVSCGIL